MDQGQKKGYPDGEQSPSGILFRGSLNGLPDV
jgi:hypothetical protein